MTDIEVKQLEFIKKQLNNDDMVNELIKLVNKMKKQKKQIDKKSDTDKKTEPIDKKSMLEYKNKLTVIKSQLIETLIPLLKEANINTIYKISLIKQK